MNLPFLRRRAVHPLAVASSIPPVVVPRPVPAAAPTVVPETYHYEVRYDRVGEWGRGATMPPAPLDVVASTRQEIEDRIGRDVVSYLPAGSSVRVIADLGLMAGQIRCGSLNAGTFSLRMIPRGGAR